MLLLLLLLYHLRTSTYWRQHKQMQIRERCCSTIDAARMHEELYPSPGWSRKFVGSFRLLFRAVLRASIPACRSVKVVSLTYTELHEERYAPPVITQQMM
jgi:hypothetical protein